MQDRRNNGMALLKSSMYCLALLLSPRNNIQAGRGYSSQLLVGNGSAALTTTAEIQVHKSYHAFSSHFWFAFAESLVYLTRTGPS